MEEINLSFCLEREILFVHFHHNLKLYQPLWFPIFLLVKSLRCKHRSFFDGSIFTCRNAGCILFVSTREVSTRMNFYANYYDLSAVGQTVVSLWTACSLPTQSTYTKECSLYDWSKQLVPKLYFNIAPGATFSEQNAKGYKHNLHLNACGLQTRSLWMTKENFVPRRQFVFALFYTHAADSAERTSVSAPNN